MLLAFKGGEGANTVFWGGAELLVRVGACSAVRGFAEGVLSSITKRIDIFGGVVVGYGCVEWKGVLMIPFSLE
jgi:hypothetical protein